MFSLQGPKALVADDRSVAWGCAQALRAQGAEIAITWVDAKAEGFANTMDNPEHSFLRMIRRGEPSISAGGTWLTVSFLGASRVVANYNVMAQVKATLESAIRYAASELAAKDIRAHALSPGPIGTRASGDIGGFDAILSDAVKRAPTGRGFMIDDVGALTASLASTEARNQTGSVHRVDGDVSITAWRLASPRAVASPSRATARLQRRSAADEHDIDPILGAGDRDLPA